MKYPLDMFQLDFVVYRVYAMEYPLDMFQLDFIEYVGMKFL